MDKLPALTEARELFADQLRKELKREGLLLDASDHIIEQAAIVQTELQQLQRIVDAQGIVYTTASRNGSTMRRTNPAYTELKQLRKSWLSLLTELGLTPMSRKRLGFVGYAEDPFD